MRIVVTGSAGHVGGNLVRALVEEGHEVHAVVLRDRRAVEGTGARIVRADVMDPAGLRRAFEGGQALFNLAARIALTRFDEGLLEEVNVRGVRNVVEAWLEAGSGRLVHFSSVHAFSQRPKHEPIDETRPLADTVESLAYDRSKALGDREVLRGMDRGLDAVVVHPSGIVGPHDYKPSNMGDVLLALARGTLPMLVPGAYDFVDVRDVVRAAIAALARGASGERYILSGHVVTVRELASIVEEVTGTRAPRLSAPLAVARLGAPFVEAFSRVTGTRPLYTRGALETLCQNCRFVNDRARGALGFEPRPFRQTVEDSIAWFRASGRLG
jgi:dihydroflavonol-4-reductase